MGKFKIIAILLLVLLIATPLGVLAIQQYQETRAIVDARHEEELQQKLREIDQKERKELELKQKEREKKAAKEEKERRKKGLPEEEPNVVIRGLVMDMHQAQTDNGKVYYYTKPEETGIFVQPYIVYNGGTSAQLRIFACHIGQKPVEFNRFDVMVSEDKKLSIKAQGEIKFLAQTNGMMQYFDQPASAEDEEAMRYLANATSAKILMPLADGPSNDDRLFTAEELFRIKDMIHLYDIFTGKRKAE